MKRLFLLLALSIPGWAQPGLDQFEKTPCWSDEFNTAGWPDPKKWSYQLGDHGWGNQELQNYTSQNAQVKGGLLKIVAAQKGRGYTSARIHTKGKADFHYGRFVVRARLPHGRGTWPAIWMLASQSDHSPTNWPDNGEIDIMEHVGFNPGKIHGSIHSKAYNHIQKTQKTATLMVPDAESAFHNYELRWTPEWIETRVDDKPVLQFQNPHLSWAEWPFDRPFHLLLNLAVGGSWGGQKGIDDSIWPQSLEVDYVRVYRYKTNPLSWLSGTYHGQSEDGRLEEVWVTDGPDLLCTTTWLSQGEISLRELARVRPTPRGYHLDLWITLPNGKSRHLEMDGLLKSARQLVFQQGSDFLTYSQNHDGSLDVKLQKKELSAFHLRPGPSSMERVVPQGDYVVHTYLGDHVFADELHFSSPSSGTLSVPGKFTSTLEKVESLAPHGVCFEILVPEGKTPYRVRYQMHFNADLSQATGVLVNSASGQSIGSFVALKKS